MPTEQNGVYVHIYVFENRKVANVILFLVLRDWDKDTMACAGTMPIYRDFAATTRIQASELNTANVWRQSYFRR